MSRTTPRAACLVQSGFLERSHSGRVQRFTKPPCQQWHREFESRPLRMNTYQVQKHFSWGSLRLEPQQRLIVGPSDIEDTYSVTQESTQQSIVVSKKALQIQLEMGTLVQC